MTLDTYTNPFEHVRTHRRRGGAQLARSEFANLLTRTPEPQPLAGKHLLRHRPRPTTAAGGATASPSTPRLRLYRGVRSRRQEVEESWKRQR